MKFLFIHQNFPGQFLHLSKELVRRNHEVIALTLNHRRLPSDWSGIKIIEYEFVKGNGKDIFELAVDFESKTIRGASCYLKALELRDEGYSPDVIISHPGWGESLFLKQVWPNSILKIYCEWYYHTSGRDVMFEPEFENQAQLYLPRVIAKNSSLLLHSEQAYSCISPTVWQASTFPDHFKKKISIIHDGIDTDTVKPDANSTLILDKDRKFSRKDEIITFVARSLEPYRGFHILMRSLPDLLKQRENLKVLIVGDDGVSYGGSPPKGYSWKKLFLEEIRPLLNDQQHRRIFFLGKLPYESYKALLCVSTVHVYLTYPFVLSWSLLEAMSSACAIVASRTSPVEEVIRSGDTGILVDFFDHKSVAEQTLELLADSNKRRMLGSNAREYVKENYDLKTKCLPEQVSWAEAL